MAKYKEGTYRKCPFCGGINIDLNLIMCEDHIFIPSILQSYVFNWYHMYLLHPRMDIMEAMICKHIYWPGMIKAVQKEVTSCGTCQRTKRSNNKYGKLSANKSE